ncbi:TrgA family protein [Paragemmobacter ruber]|uniref:TrgA family protein n=1 Tax=Paragemmobacter ruber TaxID=1985673 RepID=A0ABW9Y0Y3_9RHOB|nr:TrgA family protein [Rhodobacter ruber]NBE06152.1 TrgA family protein [Rhodobacter ruber]
MPTAAKLVAALSFAFLAWVVCIVIEGVLPEAQRVGRLYPVSIAIAALAGWFISGAAKRSGYIDAASTGVRTAMTAVLAALFAFAVATMLQVSMRGIYPGPMDALLDIVNQFIKFGLLLVHAPVVIAIFVGGAVAGMMTEWAGRRWR